MINSNNSDEHSQATSISLGQGSYSLHRERDGAGDSGTIFKSLRWPEGKEACTLNELTQVGEIGEIHLGCAIYCGSVYARSYSQQDWWLTTPVTEFLDVKDDGVNIEVRFRTENSIYIAKGRK